MKSYLRYLHSYDEVVVGAPFYSQINSDSVVPEIGRVYIFINTKVSIEFNNLHHQY